MFDITALGALIAGLLSFLSPCILPIVPFYLSYLAGVGMNQISAEAEVTPAVRRRASFSAICFAAGVITVFMVLGATATLFGQMVRELAYAYFPRAGLYFNGSLAQFLLAPERRERVLAPLRSETGFERSEERRVGKECRSRWSPDH